MGTIQTSFPILNTPAFAGMVFGAKPLTESRLAAASIPFGTFVCRRASPADGVDQCANPAASADVTARLLGIAIHNDTARNGYGYEQYQGVTYVRKGLVWMVCESSIAEQIDPFVRFAAGTGTILGALYSGADSTTAVATGMRIRTRSTLSAAGLVLVEINLP
jgi:hypothetical protein